jgi:hypothetical protein
LTDEIYVRQIDPDEGYNFAGHWYISRDDKTQTRPVISDHWPEYLHEDLVWRPSMEHPYKVYHYCQTKEEADDRVRRWKESQRPRPPVTEE